MKVEIFGPGCPRCHQTERNVINALAELDMAAEVVKITNPKEYAKYRIMFTPAVVIDGKVKVSGRIPEVAEIKTWLQS